MSRIVYQDTTANGGDHVAGINNPLPIQVRNSAGLEQTMFTDLFNDNKSTAIALFPFVSYNMLFNEQGFDRQRGNTQGTLLASAARTATLYGQLITNYCARGVVIIINVSSISGTSPTITPQFSILDPITGTNVPYGAAATAITAIGEYTFALYPSQIVNGSGTSSIGVIQLPLPRVWSIALNMGGTTPSITFSVGYALIL